MRQASMIAIAVLVTAIGITASFANEENIPSTDASALCNQLRATQREQFNTYKLKQLEKDKTFVASMAGKTVQESLPLTEKHRATQMAERDLFVARQHEDFITAIQNSNAPDATKAKLIEIYKDFWAREAAPKVKE